MNRTLEDKLRVLAEDDLTLQAINELFNRTIEEMKPEIGEGDNNVKLGEKYRAYTQAKNILKEVLQDIETYKDRKVDTKTINKGK